MSTAATLPAISVDDYLAGEMVSLVKHEYLGGFVHAMAGARNEHNLIASNCLGALYARLRGQRCKAYNSDTKIRVRMPTHVRFYYPDASVVCNTNPPDDPFQDHPVVLVEVLSRDTRRVDMGEKLDVYRTIASLSVYLLVEQESAAILVYRRTDQGFALELHQGLEAVVPLPEIKADLPLAEIYEGVVFAPEASPEE